MAGFDESLHVFHGAVGRINLLVVRDVVPHVDLDAGSALAEDVPEASDIGSCLNDLLVFDKELLSKLFSMRGARMSGAPACLPAGCQTCIFGADGQFVLRNFV